MLLPVQSYGIWIHEKELVAPGISISHLEQKPDRTSYRFLLLMFLSTHTHTQKINQKPSPYNLLWAVLQEVLGGTCTSLSIVLLWSGGTSACTACLCIPAPCLVPLHFGSISSMCNWWQSTKKRVRYIWVIQVFFHCFIHYSLSFNTA